MAEHNSRCRICNQLKMELSSYHRTIRLLCVIKAAAMVKSEGKESSFSCLENDFPFELWGISACPNAVLLWREDAPGEA